MRIVDHHRSIENQIPGFISDESRTARNGEDITKFNYKIMEILGIKFLKQKKAAVLTVIVTSIEQTSSSLTLKYDAKFLRSCDLLVGEERK